MGKMTILNNFMNDYGLFIGYILKFILEISGRAAAPDMTH